MATHTMELIMNDVVQSVWLVVVDVGLSPTSTWASLLILGLFNSWYCGIFLLKKNIVRTRLSCYFI